MGSAIFGLPSITGFRSPTRHAATRLPRPWDHRGVGSGPCAGSGIANFPRTCTTWETSSRFTTWWQCPSRRHHREFVERLLRPPQSGFSARGCGLDLLLAVAGEESRKPNESDLHGVIDEREVDRDQRVRPWPAFFPARFNLRPRIGRQVDDRRPPVNPAYDARGKKWNSASFDGAAGQAQAL